MNNTNITTDHNTTNTITSKNKQRRGTSDSISRATGSQNVRQSEASNVVGRISRLWFSHFRGQTFTTFCRALLIPGTLETTDVHRLLQSSLNPVSQAEASSRPSGKCSECVHGGLSRAVVFFLGRTCLLLIFHLGPCPNQRLCC